MNERTLRVRLEKLLSDIKSIGYDFSNYNLVEFINWLENNIAVNKKLLLIPQELGPDEFGGWVSSDIAEFFFYEAQTPRIHQAHIVLHEVSHWLCGHRTMIIEPALAEKMLEAWPKTQFPADKAVQMRSIIWENQEEIEAEMLAYLIEFEAKLSKKKASHNRFTTYLKSMELF